MKRGDAVINKARAITLVLLAALVAAMCSRRTEKAAATATTPGVHAAVAATPAVSATVPSNPLKDAYFGEQHLHTAYSLDAYIGGARLTPSDAYRFAKGEEVDVGGIKLRISAPLDWAAVTDHAEYIGEMYSTMNEGAPGYDNAQLKELRALKTIEEREKWFLEYVVKNNRGETPQHPPFYAGPRDRVERLEADRGRRRGTRRAREVHDHPRLRVERGAQGRQSPSQCLLPGRERAGTADELRRHQPGRGALGLARLPRETGHAGHRHPPQLECQQGNDVRPRRFEGQPHRPRVRRDAEPLRAADRDDAGQGKLRGPPLVLGRRRVRQLRKRRLPRGLQRTGSQEIRQDELGPLGRDQGPRLREVPRRQSVSLRLRRRDGQPQRHSVERRGKQLPRRQPRRGRQHRRAPDGPARSAAG